VSQLEQVVEAIEKKMRLLDRQARKCSKNGDHQWASVYTGRVMGLLDARIVALEEIKKGES
jgi:hypothetical protein